ncbi:GntR family transcriptional regulator [Brevibacterium sandarakinum]|nr:GntR family transcriptional regulator [Brevibacterium sandarakinum]
MNKVDQVDTGSARSVYDALWARFLDGTYASGDRLPEAALAEELGVSRTPVREALGRMLADGLVTPAARGVVVARLDHDSMRRLFDFRRNLEGFSAELTAERSRVGLIAPVWFHELRDVAGEFTAAVDGGNALAATQTNMQFHGLVVEASGNEFLADAHRRAIARLSVSTALNLEHTEWAREAASQHELIAKAIADGEVTAARDLAEGHIRSATRVFDAAS